MNCFGFCFDYLDDKKYSKIKPSCHQSIKKSIEKRASEVSGKLFNPETQSQKQNMQQTQQNIVKVAVFRVNSLFRKQSDQFKQFPSPYIRYKIAPFDNDTKALDVCHRDIFKHKKSKKNTLTIWEYHGGPNQLFYINRFNNHQFYIINVAKGFTIQTPQSTKKDKAKIIADPRNDKENQLWEILPTQIIGVYSIRSFCGKYLTVTGSRKGSKIIQTQWKDSRHQKWRIVPV